MDITFIGNYIFRYVESNNNNKTYEKQDDIINYIKKIQDEEKNMIECNTLKEQVDYLHEILKKIVKTKSDCMYTYNIVNTDTNEIIYCSTISINEILITYICSTVYKLLRNLFEEYYLEEDTSVFGLCKIFDEKIFYMENEIRGLLFLWAIDIKMIIWSKSIYYCNKINSIIELYENVKNDVNCENLMYIMEQFFNAIYIDAITKHIDRVKYISIEICNHVIVRGIYLTYAQRRDIIINSVNSRYIIDKEGLEYIINNGKYEIILLLYNYLLIEQSNYYNVCKNIMTTHSFIDTISVDMLCRMMITFIRSMNISNIMMYFVGNLHIWTRSKYGDELVNIIIEQDAYSSSLYYSKIIKYDSIKITDKNKIKAHWCILVNNEGVLKLKQIKQYVKDKYIKLTDENILILIRRCCTVGFIRYLIEECKIDLSKNHIIAACHLGTYHVRYYLYRTYCNKMNMKLKTNIINENNNIYIDNDIE